MDLLSAASNGAGAVKNPGQSGQWMLTVYGTWNTASASLELSSDDGTTWITNGDLSFSANSVVAVELPGGNAIQVRGNVSGGLGSESITMTLSK